MKNNEPQVQQQNKPKFYALIILIALVIANAIWATVTRTSGPAMGVILYVLITYFFWHNDHYNAGITGGVLAALLHLSELIRGAWVFEGITAWMLILNIALPIPLVYLSFRAKKLNADCQKCIY